MVRVFSLPRFEGADGATPRPRRGRAFRAIFRNRRRFAGLLSAAPLIAAVTALPLRPAASSRKLRSRGCRSRKFPRRDIAFCSSPSFRSSQDRAARPEMRSPASDLASRALEIGLVNGRAAARRSTRLSPGAHYRSKSSTAALGKAPSIKQRHDLRSYRHRRRDVANALAYDAGRHHAFIEKRHSESKTVESTTATILLYPRHSEFRNNVPSCASPSDTAEPLRREYLAERATTSSRSIRARGGKNRLPAYARMSDVPEPSTWSTSSATRHVPAVLDEVLRFRTVPNFLGSALRADACPRARRSRPACNGHGISGAGPNRTAASP